MEEKYISKFGSTFSIIINSLVDEIKRRNIIGKKRIDIINKLNFRAYQEKELLNLFQEMLKESFDAGRESVPKKPQENFIVNSSTDSIEKVLELFKQKAFYITGIEKDNILKKIKNILMQGIKSGIGEREFIEQLDESLKGYDIAMQGARLQTIVRTNIADVYNTARTQEFKNIEDYIDAYQYSAILDDRTSDICIALDGKIFPKSEIDKYTPPNHFGCRSIIVPIYSGEKFDGFSEMPATVMEDGNFLKVAK